MKQNKTFQPTPYERVQIARDMKRPYTLDIIKHLFTDFLELRGDRRFADDPAIVCGFAKFRDIPVVVLGHQKGRDINERRYRNFGMPKPEGYRKALRLIKMAEKFDRPIFSFIDTPGAYPGIDAEERGQAEAIAFNLREIAKIRVPIIATIVGEGGSGGALAIGICDYLIMLENAVYSVITPEGCAAILWKNSGEAELASSCLKLTANDLFQKGIVDEVVVEPVGGAHLDYEKSLDVLGNSLDKALASVAKLGTKERSLRRYNKLRNLGEWKAV